ncbi:HAMP domain-containing histidine kinase [Jatrophihabitans telluris]|uniref:Signal transduction histidine-protein kinase/phosphatase MprB n=1 Tax=Jatrophihabitans telluris TaxID=2038343 RepID=A0ABY4QYB8_9ACTN|nr:HAMP domain-containing sensor histidine kinase [Jatrophihabitans telluris]UQX88505.1 HAMP domain-containing histidine kinase [Jatrophihabitans telluris]
MIDPRPPASTRRFATRGSLAQRISLLAVAVAVITALLAGLLAIGLVSSANQTSARKRLARLADLAQTTVADTGTRAAQRRALRALPGVNVQWALLDGQGGVLAASAPLARKSVTASDIGGLTSSGSLSLTRSVAGSTVLVEGRRLPAGGALLLAQRRADATRADDRIIRRIELALVVGVVIAIALGLVVAYRIARPLKRTAAAAHALALGHRDVHVGTQGPSEVAEVGHAVNTLAVALSHSEARQREFLLSVSHDLRTPLTAITGYAESLADGVVPASEAPHVGAIMLTEAQRLNRLVSDLLDLARLDAQEFRIDLGQVDVCELARAAGAVWADRCAGVGVRFSAELPAGSLFVQTDASRLRQVLDGLFDNALRVTPAGAWIVLAVRAESAGPLTAWVVAEVRDGGPGLAEEDLPVAFDRSVLYERYRGQRQVGTGLGLTIVHGLVSRLGGVIEAGHAPEGGARFTVRLPAPPSLPGPDR